MASPLQSALALGSLAIAAVAAWYVVRPDDDWRDLLTSRFLYGVPWGTLVVVGLVLSVYLFLQGGLRHWSNPLVIPFRAWSYLYPTGMTTASFAHDSPDHLVGNLTVTVVLAPLVEFAWGHYPRFDAAADDSTRTTAGDPRGGRLQPGRVVSARVHRWLATPWIRAFVAFPAAVVIVGLLTSLFLLGPVVGFSGVVYAFGGFALLYYPVSTLVALWLGSVLRVTYLAVTDPVVSASISGSPPSPPSWATIAVQGHALGILVGVVLGLALLAARGRRPDAGRVFLAVLIYGMTQGLWAIYWYQGNGTYVLYRAVGVVLVVVLALVVAAAAARGLPEEFTVTAPTGSQAAVGALLVATSLVGGVAVFPNLGTVGADPVPGSGSVQVGDYQVTYEEDVRDGMIPAVDLPTLRDATDVRTSGVIVVSEDRDVWLTAISEQYLASEGNARVPVGGPGWRETVRAERTGWVAAGNETVYAVDLVVGDEQVRSFRSAPVRAEPRIANHSLLLFASTDEFRFLVRHRGSTVGEVPVPSVGDTTTVGDLTLETERLETEDGDDRAVTFARTDGTRVRVAHAEQYRQD